MILLGINAGFGNNDCAMLPLAAADLDPGWIDYPRPKTGLPRRVSHWPETVVALRVVLAERKRAKDRAHDGLVFITRTGQSWGKDTAENPLSDLTGKLLRSLGTNGHRNFYCLRHTFRTVADEAKDQPAADFIMGHESGHMSTVYREGISDQRLRAVVEHVHDWLFTGAEPNGTSVE
jgi:integrase